MKPAIVFKQTIFGTGVCFNMVFIHGGVFDMGGESWNKSSLPIHKVQLSDFWMAEHPVTQELWVSVMGTEKNKSNFKGKRKPVESVSWMDINDEFLPALNKLTEGKRPDGTIYHLPTEAQWEFAARGGKSSKGFDFSGGNKLDDLGWNDKNSHNETKPVGLKLPNELGLYDMSGNVWEWCNDWYRADYYAKCKTEGIKIDPPGPEEGDYRVLRGGSWIFNPQFCRVSYRFNYHPALRYDFFVFRLVLVPLPV
ncbi:MAG: formylglycine-generating enzyme family protein [Bacteroidetes bacterium]|nr:formylglycine-generating enzyme family protein [Bacteroidota bacterium]MBU1580994.1 formylglycine-generating enzyme family protein [Bacteroidota bacterium]MBU2466374.1 formylglycine-generating enzyme family protein [Bacteroidota bacterium]MBU2558839.1 formylglycine-generating enzyme family protein [Bacteroidota bacterium]